MHHRMNQERLESLDRGQILAAVAKTFEERIPFNRILGFDIELQKDDTAKLSFQMRNELIGNFLRGNLHGGIEIPVKALVGYGSSVCHTDVLKDTG